MNEYTTEVTREVTPEVNDYREPSDGYRMIPKVKKPQKPDIKDINEKLMNLRMRFTQRDDCIRLGRALCRNEMKRVQGSQWKDTDRKDDDLFIKLAQPEKIIERASAIVGALDENVRVVANDDSERSEVESGKLVAFLREFSLYNNRRFALGGGSNPLEMVRARGSFEDGRVYECLKPDVETDELHPWVNYIVDPLEVFPEFIGGRLRSVYRVRMIQISELRTQFGDNLFHGKRDDDIAEVASYWDDYWTCVFEVSGDWIKKPMAHGYEFGIPWILTHFRGWETGTSSFAEASLDDIETNRGRGALWSLVDEFDAKARMWSSLLDGVLKANTPPINVELSDNNNIEQPSTSIGAVNFYEKGGRPPEPMRMAPDLPNVKAFLQEIDAAIDFSTIPQSLLAAQSGFHQSLIAQLQEPFFGPNVEGLKLHKARLYEMGLGLYRQFGLETPVVSISSRGNEYRWAFTPHMIPEYVRVLVDFSSITKVDKLGTLAAVSSAVAANVLDKWTAHEEYLNTPNTAQVMQRIARQQALQTPAAQAALEPIYAIEALMGQAADFEARGQAGLAKLAVMQAIQIAEKMQQLGMQGGPNGQANAQALPLGEEMSGMRQGGMPEALGGFPPGVPQQMRPDGAMEQMPMLPTGGMPTGIPITALPPQMAGMTPSVQQNMEWQGMNMRQPMMGGVNGI